MKVSRKLAVAEHLAEPPSVSLIDILEAMRQPGEADLTLVALRVLLEEALFRYGGRQDRAAARLGISARMMNYYYNGRAVRVPTLELKRPYV